MGGPPPECRTTISETIKLEPDAPHFPLHLTGAADRDERRPLTVPETTPGHDPNIHPLKITLPKASSLIR